MASQLTAGEVAHIAELARLEVSPAEQEIFARQLTEILAYAATVQQVDTTAIADAVPAGTPLDAPPEPVWRADTPAPGTPRDLAIAEAPDGVRDAGLFRVPRVI